MKKINRVRDDFENEEIRIQHTDDHDELFLKGCEFGFRKAVERLRKAPAYSTLKYCELYADWLERMLKE